MASPSPVPRPFVEKYGRNSLSLSESGIRDRISDLDHHAMRRAPRGDANLAGLRRFHAFLQRFPTARAICSGSISSSMSGSTETLTLTPGFTPL